MDEQFKKNKKVTIRFLKELGLLEAWKEYLKSDYRCSYFTKRKNLNSWYEEKYVDDIFGKTNFTGYLRFVKKYNIANLISLFRRYILSMNIGLPIKYACSVSIAQYKHIVNGNK